MAFVRPTLGEIRERVLADIRSELGITSILRRTVEYAFAIALAGLSHMLHAHLQYISRQIFPDQADEPFLTRWGAIFGLQRVAATSAQLSVSVVFTAADTVPVNRVVSRSDGTQYRFTSEISSVGSGTETGTIEAIEPGSTGNMNASETLTFDSPISNVNSTVTVIATVIEGEDIETIPAYRARIVNRIQVPPAGGTVNDYEQAALSVAGVTRAWITPGAYDEGSVGITFVEDGESDIFPSAAKISEVQQLIDETMPVSAIKIVTSPNRLAVPFSIAIKPNTLAVREAITAELKDLFLREAQVTGAFETITTNYSGSISLSKINEAISLSAGEEDHTLFAPAADVNPLAGELADIDTITFSTLA